MNKTADWTLLVGRLALIALYTTSAVGKFGALDQTASMIGSKGLPFPAVLALVAAAAELIGALCIAVGYYTRAAAIGLVLYTVVVTIAFHGFWRRSAPARPVPCWLACLRQRSPAASSSHFFSRWCLA